MEIRRFARVNLDRFEHLRDEEQQLDAGANTHEGQIIALREAGDRRATAFVGWSQGRSARDLRSRTSFAMRQRAAATGKIAPPMRLLFIVEEEFHALGVKERVREDLRRLELAQGVVVSRAPRIRAQERQEVLKLVTSAVEVDRRVQAATAQQTLRTLCEDTLFSDGEGPCACLHFAYVQRRSLGFFEGVPIVREPSLQEVREQVLARMETESWRRHRKNGPRVRRTPKEQGKLF